MLVAVEESATAMGKGNGETAATRRVLAGQSSPRHTLRFALRSIALAALALLGVAPAFTTAQIVAAPGSGAQVISTQNGLPQVNIVRPSGAGVSVNTYNQFDVQKPGAILNNSPTIVQTQQAGMINGNPNLGAGQSAKIIVNQVNSSAASQINGYLEVAGPRAEVVIANGSGISVNGGGFINISRAILTTGTPNYGADGSLTGFNVTGGNVTIQGTGMNAGNVDQVDLIARAVQANATIFAKNLNVIAGANSIDHGTLNATPIAGNGPAPGVSIDVSNLGGMYANRIVLLGTENGVGVSTKGVLAAQAGDLILTTQGKLILAGQTNASGNIAINAHDGIVKQRHDLRAAVVEREHIGRADEQRHTCRTAEYKRQRRQHRIDGHAWRRYQQRRFDCERGRIEPERKRRTDGHRSQCSGRQRDNTGRISQSRRQQYIGKWEPDTSRDGWRPEHIGRNDDRGHCTDGQHRRHADE